jgi:hypothetical protein
MKLLTKAIEKKLPALYSQDGKDPRKVRVIVKFFNPCGAGTWYATEFDPVEKVFFGYAKISDGELGTFTLDDLSSVKLPFGLTIERDLHWNDKTTLHDVMEGKVR